MAVCVLLLVLMTCCTLASGWQNDKKEDDYQVLVKLLTPKPVAISGIHLELTAEGDTEVTKVVLTNELEPGVFSGLLKSQKNFTSGRIRAFKQIKFLWSDKNRNVTPLLIAQSINPNPNPWEGIIKTAAVELIPVHEVEEEPKHTRLCISKGVLELPDSWLSLGDC